MTAPFQNLNHPPRKTMLCGRSGSGKSTFWNRVILNSPYPHKFVFDHEGEFAHRNGISPALSPLELDASVSTGWTVFDPCEMFPGETHLAFAFYCTWVFEVSGRMSGEKLFACDELQKLVSTDKEPKPLLLLLETGRRRGIDALFITQAPNRLHNAIRSQVTEIVTFRMMEKNALQFLTDEGFSEEEIRSLQKGDFILRNDQVEQRGNVFKFPAPGTKRRSAAEFVTTKVFDTEPLLHHPSGNTKADAGGATKT